MDFEGPATTVDDRIVTRWRKNYQDSGDSRGTSDRPQTGFSRQKSKIERPISRRGLKNEIQEFTIVTSTYQTGFPGRNCLSIPPSTSISLNRVPTANSHVNSAIKLTSLNSCLSANLFATNASGLNRPVTQQGVAAVRPSSTRGLPRMTRQIQDKRYYEGLIQIKIRELSQEIVAISIEIDAHNKEKVTLMHYDQQAKDLAAELTDIQGKLVDYNIIVDKMTSDAGKSTIEQEACDLFRSNDLALSEIEVIFEKRHLKEKQFRKIENQVTLERKNAERIIECVDPHFREKYDKSLSLKAKLQGRIDEMQHDSDHLSMEKMILEERIALSPIKQEAVRLQTKIMEIEEKRDILQEEEKNKLSPERNKDHLLRKVKQDNIDIAASERRIAEIEKRIVEVEQEIGELEVDMNEDRSEKLIKFKELRKREEAMEGFIKTFEENKSAELKKLKKLKAIVVNRLESISSEMDGEAQLIDSQELIISNIPLKENPKNNQDFEDIRQNNVRLQRMVMKIENLEKTLKAELQYLEGKIEKCQSDLVILEDLDGLKMVSKMKHAELSAERDQLKIQKPTCGQVLENMKMKYNEIKDPLHQNETYLQINALEIKLQTLKESNWNMQNLIIENNKRMNYCFVKERTFSLVVRYNVVLNDNF